MRCSFCNKGQADVRKLIAGPAVFICDECVEACADIIRAEREPVPTPVATPPMSPSSEGGRAITCTLCGMPLPLDEALIVPARGFLCPGCCGEVEAALGERREGDR